MAAPLATFPTDNGQSLTALDRVVSRLCEVSETNGRTVIQMPVATHHGGGISVSVWPEPSGSFLVSDDGLAYHEVMVAAASERTFATVARQECERYGATFDGHSMFLMRIGPDRLKGAIVAMTTLVKEVIDVTLERSFAEKADRDEEEFVKRVSEAFSGQVITENAVVSGSSTATHRVDMLVSTERGFLAFDYFTKAPGSISAAYLKLSDIARLEDGPKPIRPIGVTSDLNLVGPKLALISSVAAVIPARASKEAFQRLAA